MFKVNQCLGQVRSFTTLILAVLILSACSQRLMQKGQQETEEATAENKKYHEFVAVGYAAVAVQKGDSDDIKMLNAIKASKIDAYKELAEQAKVLRTYHEGDLYITELGLKMKTLPNTDYVDFSSDGIRVQPKVYY